MIRLPHRQTTATVDRLRDVIGYGLDELPDAEVLERFGRYADHPSFEAILRRHGPMVWGVCRRVLANPADAEDAFQATFLVLVRKARSIRRGDRLGPWLYGVAYRVATKARSRVRRHSEATDMIPDPTPETPDWLPILDAELSGLPANYREPLVLCELQGASRAEAAKTLRIPEGTLSSRLARGRDLLRKRLLKHGTLLPAGGIAALFAANGLGLAAVPAGLLAKTSEVAAVAATGVALSGVVPAGPARLMDEVLKGMLLTKLRLGLGGVVALLVMAVGLAAVPADDRPHAQNPQETTTRGPARPVGVNRLQPTSGPPLPADDVQAIQGWWALTAIDQTKAARQKEAAVEGFIGRSRLFVAGDVWWQIDTWGGETQRRISPRVATLLPGKNPKWLDLLDWHPGREGDPPNQTIYLLDQNELRVILAVEGGGRPAEFNTQDEESKLLSLVFARQEPPRAAGEQALHGSWEQSLKEFRIPGSDIICTGNGGVPFLARVEIYDGVIFVGNLPSLTVGSQWIGGTYTVDGTRNPPGIDVDLFNPLNDGVSKIYGSYETTRDGLKLVLGLTGKRAARPMDFTPPSGNGAPDRMYFELSRAALRAGEKPCPAPAPRAK